MLASTSERVHLGHNRGERLLGGIGVDRLLAGPTPYVSPLDAVTQKVESFVDVTDLVFSTDRRRPMGASTALISSRSASACARVPRIMTTKSSA
jgi:hypothetical protein